MRTFLLPWPDPRMEPQEVICFYLLPLLMPVVVLLMYRRLVCGQPEAAVNVRRGQAIFTSGWYYLRVCLTMHAIRSLPEDALPYFSWVFIFASIAGMAFTLLWLRLPVFIPTITVTYREVVIMAVGRRCGR